MEIFKTDKKMKTLSIIAVVLGLGFVSPCAAQKYNDSLLEGARGNVKTITDDGWTYEYDRDGQLVSYSLGDTEYGFQIKRNAQNEAVSFALYKDSECTQFIYKKDCEYNGEGNIVTERVYVSDDMKNTTLYYYNLEGLQIQAEYYVDGKLGSVSKYIDIQCDQKGNWISRKVESKRPKKMKKNYRIETRKITYWD